MLGHRYESRGYCTSLYCKKKFAYPRTQEILLITNSEQKIITVISFLRNFVVNKLIAKNSHSTCSGSSWASGRIRAAAACLCHNYSNTGSKLNL